MASGRLARHRIRPAAIVGLAAAASAQLLAVHQVVTPSTWRVEPAYRAADAALALIPPDANIAATNRLVPHLTHRFYIRLLDPGTPPVTYLVAAIGDPSPAGSFPSHDQAAMLRLVAARARSGHVIFSRGGIVVVRF